MRGRGEVGVPRNIMRALCAVIRLDHLKLASYGPAENDLRLLSSLVLSSGLGTRLTVEVPEIR